MHFYSSLKLGIFANSFSGCSAVGSALRSGRRGRRFESCHPDLFGLINHANGTIIDAFGYLNFEYHLRNIMKLFFVAIALFFVFGMSSCNLTGESNHTPDIYFLRNPIRNHTDTLKRYYTDKPGVFLMDTIQVGDTVQFYMYLEGYTNHLTSLRIQSSPDSVAHFIWGDRAVLDAIFLPSSQFDKGIFLMDGTHTALFFPFKLVALKPSAGAKIGFLVTSDALFKDVMGSNANGFELITPIQPKRP